MQGIQRLRLLTDDGGLQIDEHCTWHMLSSASLAKEGVEGVVSATDSLVGRHLTVWLYAVLQAVELPAGISNLDTSLSNVDRDTLTL